jgi:class 3 adenylate cyclase
MILRTTGLGMIEATGQLHRPLTQVRGMQLAVRLGVHTGLMVVGDSGGRPRQEPWALSEAPKDVQAYRERRRPCSVVPCGS